MLNAITSIFKELFDAQSSTSEEQPDLAIACLLTEVACADHHLAGEEKIARRQILQKVCQVSETAADALLHQADQLVRDSASLYDFTSQLRSLSHPKRYELIQAMWELAHTDGYIDPLEDAVIRKTAELLYVDHSEFIRAKISVSDNI
ncbi:Tellurite resistance protein TerB [Vibrio aerogenes CECT 7868]|uniref:Tellurite resistance protein TerB n=1 Tax=Vibrio aerogenes CECT 7868 TaxID=1216006 RepID=A0A1M5Z7W7_9VIBR|nr:TerB family tellurite resistance protein [Vibrio aerogenes]SHI20339.1 Tellurite resistance protein TerB [Vibrio aerogenes CECT 7868]